MSRLSQDILDPVTGVIFLTGEGEPQASWFAPAGSLYSRRDGVAGNTLWQRTVSGWERLGAATAGLSGSLTNGRIPVATGASSLADSLLTQLAGPNRVTVGGNLHPATNGNLLGETTTPLRWALAATTINASGLATLDGGATFGANSATTGNARFPNQGTIGFRNAANNDDIEALRVDALNVLRIVGQPVQRPANIQIGTTLTDSGTEYVRFRESVRFRGAVAFDVAPTGVPTASGTTNRIARFTGTSALGDSGMTDDGTLVSLVSRNLSVSGTLAASGTATLATINTSGPINIGGNSSLAADGNLANGQIFLRARNTATTGASTHAFLTAQSDVVVTSLVAWNTGSTRAGQGWVQTTSNHPLVIGSNDQGRMWFYTSGGVSMTGADPGTGAFRAPIFETDGIGGAYVIRTRNTGASWVWYNDGGIARLWQSGDFFTISSTLAQFNLAVSINNSMSATGRITANLGFGALDVRQPSPSNVGSSAFTPLFTAYLNDNNAPWADALAMRSYGDGTGGSDHLLVFDKTSANTRARLYRQAFGSTTAWGGAGSQWREFLMTEPNANNIRLASDAEGIIFFDTSSTQAGGRLQVGSPSTAPQTLRMDIRKTAHASGASAAHLELGSADPGTSAGELSIRYHLYAQWWLQLRGRSDGFHMTGGSDNAPVSLSLAGLNFKINAADSAMSVIAESSGASGRVRVSGGTGDSGFRFTNPGGTTYGWVLGYSDIAGIRIFPANGSRALFIQNNDQMRYEGAQLIIQPSAGSSQSEAYLLLDSTSVTGSSWMEIRNPRNRWSFLRIGDSVFGNYWDIAYRETGGHGDTRLGFRWQGTGPQVWLTSAGNVHANDFVLTSDRRFKTEIRGLTRSLDAVLSIAPVRYRNIRTGRQEVGVIAQDLAPFLPEAVIQDGDGTLGVSYDRLVPLLLGAIRELRDEVASLQKRN